MLNHTKQLFDHVNTYLESKGRVMEEDTREAGGEEDWEDDEDISMVH